MQQPGGRSWCRSSTARPRLRIYWGKLCGGADREQRGQIEKAVLDSMMILYVEGAVDDLQGP